MTHIEQPPKVNANQHVTLEFFVFTLLGDVFTFTRDTQDTLMKYSGKFDRRKTESATTELLVNLGIRYQCIFGDKMALAFWAGHAVSATVAERVMCTCGSRRAQSSQSVLSERYDNVACLEGDSSTATELNANKVNINRRTVE